MGPAWKLRAPILRIYRLLYSDTPKSSVDFQPRQWRVVVSLSSRLVTSLGVCDGLHLGQEIMAVMWADLMDWSPNLCLTIATMSTGSGAASMSAGAGTGTAGAGAVGGGRGGRGGGQRGPGRRC